MKNIPPPATNGALTFVLVFCLTTATIAAPYTLYLDNTHTGCAYFVKVHLGHGHCGGCDGCCYEGVTCDVNEPECAGCCDNGICNDTCGTACCWVCEDQADPITYHVGAGQVITPTLPSGLGVCSYEIFDASMTLVTGCDTETAPGCSCTFPPAEQNYYDCHHEPCVIDMNAT